MSRRHSPVEPAEAATEPLPVLDDMLAAARVSEEPYDDETLTPAQRITAEVLREAREESHRQEAYVGLTAVAGATILTIPSVFFAETPFGAVVGIGTASALSLRVGLGYSRHKRHSKHQNK